MSPEKQPSTIKKIMIPQIKFLIRSFPSVQVYAFLLLLAVTSTGLFVSLLLLVFPSE